MAKHVGRTIADLRERMGLTQAVLAERIGVGTETVSRIERGATLPSLPTLERIATSLNARSADLLSISSRKIADVAARIATVLEGLSERDRAFVSEWVERLAEHLRAKG